MGSNRPIGVLDSGAGGLAILFEIERLLPLEDCLYYADTLHCPWGSRSPSEIQHLAAEATERLLDENVKLIVVACNTASTLALPLLRAHYDVPFVGTVPAIKPAALATRSGHITVLATTATVGTEAVQRLIQDFASDHQVSCRACPDRLVELVEAGQLDMPEVESIIQDALRADLMHGVDTVVLGCTHYAFLRPVVQRVTGPNVTVLDTGMPIARQVRRVLEEANLLRRANGSGSIRYLASGDPLAFTNTARYLRSQYVHTLGL